MDSYFASPERTPDRELAFEIDLVSKNPVMSGLLHSISGLLAILDEHRQIINALEAPPRKRQGKGAGRK